MSIKNINIKNIVLITIFIFLVFKIEANSPTIKNATQFENRLLELKKSSWFGSYTLFDTETKKEVKINYDYIFGTGVVLQSVAILIGVSFLPVLVMGIVKIIDFQDRAGYAPKELADELGYFLVFGVGFAVSFAIQIPAIPLMAVGSKKTN